jgi:hypothetical protein
MTPHVRPCPARRFALAAAGTLALALGTRAAGATGSPGSTGVNGATDSNRAGGATAPVLPPDVAAEVRGARLAGAGAMRWFGFTVYHAQLWVGSSGFEPERFAQAPFVLNLRYGMTLAGTSIAERSIEEIARLGLGDAAQHERWLASMRSLFPDVSRDHGLAGVNRPGRGAAFYHNGRLLGSIDDPAFAAAFFAIWLDPRTVAPSLRSALLQNTAGG